MKYTKSGAKAYAKKNIKGLWGASLTPFTPDCRIDEDGIRHNIRHCIDPLQIDGMFFNGLLGEGFHQTIAERKRTFKIAVEESRGRMAIMPYTSDPVIENALDMTRYADEIGADYAILINPKFYFGAMTDEGVFQYFKTIADGVDIGIMLFNQMEHGYLMGPDLINRIADIENVVGLKTNAPERDILRTRMLCGDRIVVSDVRERNWLANLTVGGQEALIATSDPFCLQSGKLMLLKAYTDAAMAGDMSAAWDAYKRLEPIRRAVEKVTVPGKVQAALKFWTQCLGMAGGDGRVRLPQMGLTDSEKEAIKAAVEGTELV